MTEIAIRASLPDKLRWAEVMAGSGLLPADFRRHPANVLYAVEYGDMLGLSPMAALTGVHVIDGKPTASAALISALIRRAGHRLRITGDDRRAVVQIVRCDDPDFTYESTWTLDRAVTAELCTLRNGKPYARDTKGRAKPWEKYPAAMLKARALTECARDACEEALFGLHYTPEELGADVDMDGNPVTVATTQRVDQPPAEAAPPGQPETADVVDVEVVEAEVVEADPAAPVDEDRLASVVLLLGTLGVDEKPRRLVLARELVGRWIASATDMTCGEADLLIVELRNLAGMDEAQALVSDIIDNPQITEDAK